MGVQSQHQPVPHHRQSNLASIHPPHCPHRLTADPKAQPHRYYTYGLATVSTSPPIEFVPMLWGGDQARLSQWDSSINSTIQQHGVTHVLAFNEPNEAGQADLSPAAAAALWQQHIQPLKAHGVLLGSPAPSARPNGMQWLRDFMTFCGGCTVDFIALHQEIPSTTSIESNIVQYHDAFPGKPIWVTQLACLVRMNHSTRLGIRILDNLDSQIFVSAGCVRPALHDRGGCVEFHEDDAVVPGWRKLRRAVRVGR